MARSIAGICFALGVLAAGLSCAPYRGVSPSGHVVAAPVSVRANVVLRNLVEEYGSADGRWRGCLSPGCAPIWASQFGYCAGVRRDREDVVALGRATAGRVSGEIRGLFWDALFGDVDENDPAVLGFPALLVSGSLGGSGMDAFLFSKGLGRLGESHRPEALRPRENAGLAALLAGFSILEPERREEWLGQAREFAAGAAESPILAFFGRAAIARCSGAERDLEMARAAEGGTPYRFSPLSGALSPLAPADEVLSRHLAMAHGLADVAQATGDRRARSRALALLDHVLSDAYFDGRFLVHDRRGGRPSKAICSGCNFMALHLVDRLYGDSFVIDPVPELPERDWPEEEAYRKIDAEFVLESGEKEFALGSLDSRGKLRLSHATHDVATTIEYRMLPTEELEPRGGVELRCTTRGGDAKVQGTWTLGVPFDEGGVADLGYPFGFRPLTFRVVVRRDEDGDLSATVLLSEGEAPADQE